MGVERFSCHLRQAKWRKNWGNGVRDRIRSGTEDRRHQPASWQLRTRYDLDMRVRSAGMDQQEIEKVIVAGPSRIMLADLQGDGIERSPKLAIAGDEHVGDAVMDQGAQDRRDIRRRASGPGKFPVPLSRVFGLFRDMPGDDAPCARMQGGYRGRDGIHGDPDTQQPRIAADGPIGLEHLLVAGDDERQAFGTHETGHLAIDATDG